MYNLVLKSVVTKSCHDWFSFNHDKYKNYATIYPKIWSNYSLVSGFCFIWDALHVRTKCSYKCVCVCVCVCVCGGGGGGLGLIDEITLLVCSCMLFSPPYLHVYRSMYIFNGPHLAYICFGGYRSIIHILVLLLALHPTCNRVRFTSPESFICNMMVIGAFGLSL